MTAEDEGGGAIAEVPHARAAVVASGGDPACPEGQGGDAAGGGEAGQTPRLAGEAPQLEGAVVAAVPTIAEMTGIADLPPVAPAPKAKKKADKGGDTKAGKKKKKAKK